MAAVLETVITNVFNLLNAGSYFRETDELTTAISLANTQLYQIFRGNMKQFQKNSPKAVLNFGETTVTLDSLSELMGVRPFAVLGNFVVIEDVPNDRVDLIEAIYLKVSPTDVVISDLKIVPRNQFQTMLKNKVIPPTSDFPIGCFNEKGVIDGVYGWVFTVYPGEEVFTADTGEAHCVLYPAAPIFTMTDNGGPIPTIVVTQDLSWTEEKIPALTYLTIQNLGFTLQNGVIAQLSQMEEAKSL